MPISLWIVEDDATYRRVLRRLFDREPGLTCTQVFSNCRRLFEALVDEPHPDLVLMDLGLPGLGGVEGIRHLAQVAPGIAVVVLTVFEEKAKVVQALDAGATGYLLKTATGPEIVSGIHQVFRGGAVLSPSIAKIVLQEFHRPSPSASFSLTAREIEVLEQLAEGLVLKEIADRLGIARSTVATHLEKIYAKLEVQSQSGAVAKALRAGLI